MSSTHYTISLNTCTEEHVSTETWNVDEETFQRYKAAMDGEPDTTQLVPFDLIDDMLADGRHIAL